MLILTGLVAHAEPQNRGSVDANLDQSRGYVRIGGTPLEIVKDSNALEASKLLHPNTWNPDLSLSKLKTLVLQHIHVKANEAKTEAADSVLIPYVSEVYFQQRHDSVTVLGANVGEGVQATIRFSGHLRARVMANYIAAVVVTVETFQVSNPTETTFANLTEHLNRYDSRFINDVGISILTRLFQLPESRAQLKKVFDSRK